MGKSTNLFKIALGIGGAITAVALSRKESRDKLKQEYNKYKENPESYKSSAKDLATQIGNKANETIQEVKKNPKDYVERIKSNPKEFLEEEEKSKIIGKNDQTQDDIEEGKFDAEGGATVNNNLRVVTEDDLKNNKNALQDKKE
ncbi:YtxH domain-containing protein [Staphylococcus epidermidis]|nr:YtxH domain-containing protein [Staphylococcus epidermidis]MCG2487665.1 YtxH domain-containing protein [Staphylococcus epidermidis]